MPHFGNFDDVQGKLDKELMLCYTYLTEQEFEDENIEALDTLLFFNERPTALPIYQVLEEKILVEIQDVNIKVQKSQIAFSNRHNFAFVSFIPVRKAKEYPKVYITVTFGLSYKKESSRIDVATEPYPNRWTHHVLVSSIEEIDDELLGWIKEASDFSAVKR